MQEIVDKQNQASSSAYPVLYKADVSKLAQYYDPFHEINQMLALLSAEDTSITYQKAAENTWVLLKKAIVLLLFLSCFVVALLIWVCSIGFQAGFHFREWLEVEQPPMEKILSQLLEYLAWPFKQAYAWASWFIEKYLNWKISFDTPEPKPSPPSSPSPATPLGSAPGNSPAT